MTLERVSTEKKVALAVGGGLVGLVGCAALYYLMAGAGSEKNAALIPDSIEARLDTVVDALNDQFGKQWVDFGIAVLQAGLAKILPPALVALVAAVYKSEQAYWRHSGACKRRHAIRFAWSARAA